MAILIVEVGKEAGTLLMPVSFFNFKWLILIFI